MKDKTSSYEVRTEHINKDGSPKYINRLIREDSPYLLQHAHNPVNWYAWGDEAFAAAKKSNKPVFLSIGYSTCHWCHVMEGESFDNEEVAEILNRHFISIKVDREQRPDLDEIYMTAVQIFIGHGGWPMSSFLTPDGKPFFGGTYYPQQQFKLLLTRVNQAWTGQEEKLRQDADKVAQQVSDYMSSSLQAASLENALISYWTRQILSRYDHLNGGFTAAPKFPNETDLLLLLDQLKRSKAKDSSLQKAITHTLNRMAQGGIYDQVAGGFHRYSTDKEWLVPHFEKMLYNQALLGRVYAESYFLTGNLFHRQIAIETFDYVLRDMTAASGGFYSATDADSEDEEGKFFVWDKAQLQSLLSKEDYLFVESLYDISEAGNFEERNLLYLPEIPKAYWAADAKQWLARLQKIKAALYREREKRIHPLRDEKIITAWNGMMITGLVKGADVLGNDRYLNAAKKSAEYLWEKHFDKSGRLSRISLNGTVSIQGTQEDYAYFSEGLLAIYHNTNDAMWLDRAQRVMDEMVLRFMDKETGGFYLSAKQTNGPLISNIKSTRDGATPSGNSVALAALVSMVGQTENLENQKVLNKTLAFFSGALKQQGGSHSYALRALSDSLNGEIDSKISLAAGHVHASIEWTDNQHQVFEVSLSIAPGWHINANHITQKNLIATSINLPTSNQHPQPHLTLQYPAAKSQALSFQSDPLHLFNGSVVVQGAISGTTKQPVTVVLELQACDDQHCLPPEKRKLILSFVNE
ncbi:MAG: thioredoxin domain-containing protein [Pseudomonadales bacterium]